jgi:hypothetical protein
MVVEIITATSIIGYAFISHQIKKMIKEFEDDFDSDQLCYKLKRNAIICPRCSSVHFTQTFEEQLNDKWECPTCSCQWYETHTHDIVKE